MKVWVNDDERAEIERRAKLAGMSQSAYLRATGLNHPIQSVLDFEAVEKLAKVSGDLSRLSTQLKAWLSERPGQGARSTDMQRLLDENRALQTAIVNCMGAVLIKRRR